MCQLFEISNIIFPHARDLDVRVLYYRKDSAYAILNKECVPVHKFSFNTWMNAFASNKYFYYCEIKKLYLKLNILGNYRINIIGTNTNQAFGTENSVIIDKYCNGYSEIYIPNASKYEMIYFDIFESKYDPINFVSASWCTDTSPQRKTKLAIISCTFKRENFIYKNIELFKNYLENNQSLKERLFLFIVDNGKTLTPTKNENIIIIQNINAGGAGGFARGLYEAKHCNLNINRVIFMDDDVEFIAESFYRTLILSDYLKSNYKDSLINGAMLDLYHKDIFFENMGVQDGLWVHPIFNSVSLKDYNSVLYVNKLDTNLFNHSEAKIHGGWYYHSFSIDTAKQKGFPLPFFIRGDDVEWSWRNFSKHHIAINGICLWHSPFLYRVSNISTYYFLPRNMFFVNIVHNSNFKKQFTKLYKRFFTQLLISYDYTAIDLFLRALKDILNKEKSFIIEPELLLQSLKQIESKRSYYECNNSDVQQAFSFKNHIHKWQKKLYYFSNYGLFVPKIFYRKKSYAINEFIKLENCIFYKKIIVVNPLTKLAETRNYNFTKSIKYQKTFKKLLLSISNHYDELEKSYKTSHKYLSSENFWVNYLHLK